MFFKELYTGLKSYLIALKFIKQNNLFSYFLIPALLGILIGLTILFLGIHFSEPLSRFVIALLPFNKDSDFINTAGKWTSFVLIVGIGLIFYKHLVAALSAPFMGALSEKTEEIITQKPVPSRPFFPTLIRGIRINLRNLFYELLYSIPLLLLSFIPILNIASTLLLFYVQSYYAGIGNLDYTLERYLDYQNSLNFIKKHRGISVGNGIIFTTLLLFTGLIITLPLSTVAATISILDRKNPLLKN